MRNLILQAGEEKIIPVPGGAIFFYPYECTHGFFEVDYGRGATVVGRTLGIEARDEFGQVKPFRKIRLINTNSEAMTVSFLLGYDKPFDARAGGIGNVTVTGTVAAINQPLSDDGGSITAIGLSQYGGLLNLSSAASDPPFEIFSAAENVNGVILRNAGLILPGASLGDSTTAYIITVETRVILARVTWDVRGDKIDREIFIPSDNGLEITATNDRNFIMWGDYDIL